MNRIINLTFANDPTKILPEQNYFNFGDDLDIVISNLDNAFNGSQIKVTLFNYTETLEIFEVTQAITVTNNTGTFTLNGSLFASNGIVNNKLYFLKIEIPSTNLIVGSFPFWCQNGPGINPGGVTPTPDLKVNESLGFISPKKFGAVGDGVANDYQAVQDTINYASENALSVILDGCFNCFGNTVTYPKHTIIRGLNKFGVEIGGRKLPQLLNLKLISEGFHVYNNNGYNANSANGCFFGDFLVNFYAVSINDLSKPNNTYVNGGFGWYHHGTALNFVNMNLTNAQGDVFIAMTPPNYTDANLFGSKYGDVGHPVFINCIFRNGSNHGFWLQGNDAMISHCYSEFNQGWGFVFDSPAGGNPKQRSLGTIGIALHPFLNELGGIKLADENDANIQGNGQFIGCEIEGVKGTALSIGKGASGTKVTGGRVFLTPLGIKVLAKCEIDTELRRCGISYQIGDATTVVANCRIRGEISVFPTDTPLSIGPAHPLPQAAFKVDNTINYTTNNQFDVNVILFDDSTTAGLWNYQVMHSTVSNADSTAKFEAMFNNQTSSTKNSGKIIAKTGAGVSRHTADNSPLPVSQIQSNWNETNVNSRQFIQNKPLVGQELTLDVRNSSGSTINKGQVVYISGATGQNPTISLARADVLNTSEIIGVATANISNNTTGKVTVIGLVNDIDTSAFSDGQQVYLSATTAGALTATPPTSPNFVTFIGYIAHSHPTQGKLVIMSNRAMANNNSLGTSQTAPASQNSVKQYVDTNLSTKVSKSGDTISGVFTNSNPVTQIILAGDNTGDNSDGSPNFNSSPRIELGTYQVSEYRSGEAQRGGYSELVRLRALDSQAKPTLAYYDHNNKPVAWLVSHFQPQDLRIFANLASFPVTGVDDGLRAYFAQDTGLYYTWNGSGYTPLLPTNGQYYYRAIHQHISLETAITDGVSNYTRFALPYGLDVIPITTANAHFRVTGGANFGGKEFGAFIIDKGKVFSGDSIILYPNSSNADTVETWKDSATDNIFINNTQGLRVRKLANGNAENITSGDVIALNAEGVNNLMFNENVVIGGSTSYSLGINRSAGATLDVQRNLGNANNTNYVIGRFSRSDADGFLELGYRGDGTGTGSHLIRAGSSKPLRIEASRVDFTNTIEATNFVTPIPRGSGGTRHWGLFGAGFNSGGGTSNLTVNSIRFIPFFVPKTTTLSAFKCEVTAGPASNANLRFGIYSTNSDLQPVTLQYDSGNVAVASGFTGAVTINPTTVLSIGWYLLACNTDVAMTLRTFVTPSPFVADPFGATPFIQRFDLVSTFAAYPASGATINWNTVNQSTGGLQHIGLFQYTQ